MSAEYNETAVCASRMASARQFHLNFPMGNLSMHGGGFLGIPARVGPQIAPYGA